MKIIGIYKITNIVTGKCYVGSAVDLKDRFRSHRSKLFLNKHHSPKLQNSYNKHGLDKFVYEIIEECPKGIIIEREQYYIDLYDSYNKGYNSRQKAESMLGFKFSEESKKKMSDSQKGKKRSKESIEKSRQANIGRKMPPDAIEKTRQAKIGKKRSDETKEKLRQANLGKKHSDETRKKMSESHRAKKNSVLDK